MRVKRRDEHTVTDDRCISLFSFPSPRRPAVRRGNEVRPPACHLGSWEKGWGGWVGGVAAVGWLRRRGRAHCLHPPSCILHDNEDCHSLSASLAFSSSLCMCVCARVCVWVHVRVPTERDKWLPRSLLSRRSLLAEKNTTTSQRDGDFSRWWRAVFRSWGN